MSLIRYKHDYPFTTSWTDFESLVNRLTDQSTLTNSNVTYETKDDKIYYEIIVPGFEKEEIEISVEKNRMDVKAKNDKRDFKTTFSLFKGYESEPKEAKLKNGILTVVFNKAKEEKGIKISIQ